MDNEKVIVTLLLIAILLSVVTLAITMSASVSVEGEAVNPANLVDTSSGNVQLEITPNPATGGTS
jgi:hypothetical protein